MGDGHLSRENYPYFGGSGWTYVEKSNSIIIELLQAYEINTIRFLLYELDYRTYDLTVEISYDTDYTHFKKVYDSVNA